MRRFGKPRLDLARACALATTLALAMSATHLGAAELPAGASVPDTLPARIAPCTHCHGERGEGLEASAYFPRLAGKPAGYLYRQLRNFAEGRRRYPEMNYLVRQLPSDYLLEISRWFSEQHPPYPPRRGSSLSRAESDRIEALVRHGDKRRDLPGCTACHGDRLGGIEPATPGLVGLHAHYVAAQLDAWRHGVRHAAAPDCMRDIAKRLTGEEIHGISAWLASRAADPEPRPEPASATKPPLECGSFAKVAGE